MRDPETAALLLDFYGGLLTGRQREFYDLYHNHDLSLSEIAENAGITRQAVRDALTRAEASLEELETQLELVTRFLRMRGALAEIRQHAGSLAHTLGDSETKARAERIFELVGQCESEFLQ